MRSAAQQTVARYTTVVSLTGGQNADSQHADVTGAKWVSFTVSAPTTEQLTAASPQVQMTDGKQATLTPGAFPGGTSNAALNLNAAGVITTADLSTTTPRLVLLRGAGDPAFTLTSAPAMAGVQQAWITLTRAAGAGTVAYTVVMTVYY